MKLVKLLVKLLVRLFAKRSAQPTQFYVRVIYDSRKHGKVRACVIKLAHGKEKEIHYDEMLLPEDETKGCEVVYGARRRAEAWLKEHCSGCQKVAQA